MKEHSGKWGWYDVVRVDGDNAVLFVNVVSSSEQARTAFARSGDQFVEPKLTGRVARVDRSEAPSTAGPPVRFDPPLISHEVLPGVGDENYVWRGYGNNDRGVINLRTGNVIAHINAPSVDDAERIAGYVAELLGT